MLHGLSCLLLVCLIASVSSLTYVPLTLTQGTATSSGDLNPCARAFYSVDIADTDRNPLGYLEVKVTSDIDSLIVTISDAPFDATSLLDGNLPNHIFHGEGSDVIVVDAICPFSSTATWYITIDNQDNGSGDSTTFDLSVTQDIVTVTELIIGTPYAKNTTAHDQTSFKTSFDFFHFTTTATSAGQGETLNITTSGATSDVTAIYFNKGSVPAYGFDTNTCVNGNSAGSALIVDYCTWNNLLSNTAGTDYYIAIAPGTASPLGYNILVQTEAPVVTLITDINTISNTVNSLTPLQIDYFSFSVSDTEDFINATIANVQGGVVDFTIEFNTLPFVSCLGGSNCNQEQSNCCDNISSSCELVIQPCHLSEGTYYIGVSAVAVNNENIPLTYQLNIGSHSVPGTVSLSDSDFKSASIATAHYDYYEYSPSGNSEVDSTLDVHLYVDRTENSGTQTTLYINTDELAGDNCWGSIASCTVTAEGSCSIQINPCQYAAFDSWYITVYGGDFQGNPTDYTVFATMSPPTELTESHLVVSSSVVDEQIQQYRLDSSLLPSGSVLSFIIFDTTGGDLNVFMSENSLAGPTNTCPPCYNYTNTDTTTNGEPFSWIITNCDDEDMEDIYFSVQGVASSGESSVGYSLTIIASDNTAEPSGTLDQSEVLIDSVQANGFKNYTINADGYGSEDYLQFSMTQVNYQNDNFLIVNVYNTSNLNCLLDTATFSAPCMVDENGYCTIIVQTCQFNSSSGWIVEVVNSNDEEIFYNLVYNVFSSKSVGLTNSVAMPSTVAQGVYDQYFYGAMGGDTLTIEVFFDKCLDITGAPCEGQLYLSRYGQAGPSDCFYDSVVQTATDKCVFTLSSCDLPEQDFYFSVTTNSVLYPEVPLGYTIKVTEKSPVVPVQLNIPYANSAYPNEKIYHTFTYTSVPASGSRISVQVQQTSDTSQGSIEYFLAQTPPPTTSGSCPCFEYSASTSVDYCDSVSGEWTVLVQPSGEVNTLVNYIITVIEFLEPLVQLTLNTPVDGSVLQYRYDYYTLGGAATGSNDQFTLSIQNVVGGTVEIYRASDNPATAACSTASICGAVSDSCLTQIGACIGSPNYISVYGSAVTSYDPVTYTISVIQSTPVSLEVGQASIVQYVDANFVQFFSFDINTPIGLTDSSIVSFEINNAQSNSTIGLNYGLNIFETSACGDTIETEQCNEVSCTVSVSDCTLDSVFFLGVVNGVDEQMNFTVTATVTNIAATLEPVAIGTAKTVDIAEGDWVTFSAAVDNASQTKSLTYTITSDSGTFQSYFGLTKATPDCNEHETDDPVLVDSDSVGACCVQDGNYVLAVQAIEDASVTVLFDFVNLLTTTVEVTDTTTSTSADLGSSETQEFMFTLNATVPYASYYVVVSVDNQAEVYLQRASVAGPSAGGECITSMDNEAIASTYIFNSLQCEVDNALTLATPYQGGSFFVGVENTAAARTTIDITIQHGMIQYVPLSIGNTTENQMALSGIMYYYSFEGEIDMLEDVTVDIESDLPVNAVIYFESACSGQADTCTGASCSLTASSACYFNGKYIVSITAPTTATFSITPSISAKSGTIIDLDTQSGDAVTGNIYATASVSADIADNNPFAELILSNYTGNTGGLTVFYSIDQVGSCLSGNVPITCENDGTTTTCVVAMDSCLLAATTYVFEILGTGGATYDLSWATTSQVVTAIDFPSVTVGSVFENERVSYDLTIDYTSLFPGESIYITLTEECGSASLWLNQGSVAGPECFFSSPTQNDNSIIISACDLMGAPLVDYMNNAISLTVVGGTPAYPTQDLPSQYILEVNIQGPPASFRPIGPNQLTAFGGQNIIYVLPVVSGIADLVGELEISLIGATSSATLSIQYSEPTFCNSVQTLSVTGSQTDSVIVNSCTLASVDQVYFSFDAGSDADAAFEIVHINPFIRDLNQYTTIPQTGAVVPSDDGDTQMTDEEYYTLMVDSSAENFQFTAWLEDASNDIMLLGAVGLVPTMCNADDTDVTSVTPRGMITYDWCDLEDSEAIYLTVNAPSNTLGSTSEGYDLYYSTTVEIEATTLVTDVPICDIVADETNYYTAELITSPSKTFYAEIYSVSADTAGSEITAYLSFGGLATAHCTNAADIKTCSTGSTCRWEFTCATNGNASIAIENTGTTVSANYFIVWGSETITTTPIAPGTPLASPVPVDGTSYFSVVLPVIDQTSQYVIISVRADDDDDAVAMLYSETSIPSANCQDGSCSADGLCYITVNSCDYPTGTTSYIAITTDSTFTVSVDVFSIPVTPLTMNTFAESSLTTDGVVPVVYSGYKLSVTQDMIANSLYGDMVVNVYGVNQGQITVFISSFGTNTDCLIAQEVIDSETSSSANLVVTACRFTVGDYYITAMLDSSDQLDSCTAVTFGVMATYQVIEAPSTPLTSNTPVTVEYSLGPSYFTFASNSDLTSVMVTSDPSLDVVAALWTPAFATTPNGSSEDCYGETTTPVSYYFGCTKLAGNVDIIAESYSLSGVVLPGSSYTVTANSQPIANITDTPATFTFQQTFQTSYFHAFTLSEDQSLQIVLDVNQGPAVEVQVWDQSCSSGGNNVELFSMTCYNGVCMIPFGWSIGSLSNSTSPYYVSVSGYGPASYDISIEIGEEETCVELPETDLCDISWSVWSYNSGTQQEYAQEAAALRFYNQLATAFCQPCSCQEISQKCNNSLIEYTCTQTYRACGDNGLQSSVCEDSCSDIEENCGLTFEQAGLPMFSCNHNFYYNGDNDICVDVYGIEETDASDILLYIVLILVVFVVIIIIVAIILYVVFKKYKTKRLGDTYEKIADADSDED